MGISRVSLRKEAKKIYKEKVKGVPKKQRIPFPEFFKQFKALKSGKIDDINVQDNTTEDFDFEDMINIDEDIEEENQ